MSLQTLKQFRLLPREFYIRDTRTVARELIGKVLYYESHQGVLAGIITETEAYLGVRDKACHAYNGRKTERVKSLYLNGGHSYVYKIYGLHHCLNVVTQAAGNPQAVLIRGVLPLSGEESMRRNRGAKEHLSVADGPGKLCQAFGLTKEHDGWDFLHSALQISELLPTPSFKVQKTPRIGVDYAEEWAEKKLRYLAVPNGGISAGMSSP